MKKNDTYTLPVNLQQGFILDKETNQIIAAYSHHKRAILTKEPIRYYNLADEFKGYKVIGGVTDSFGIQCWTNKGDMSISAAIEMQQESA